jgi:hypothetical protein
LIKKGLYFDNKNAKNSSVVFCYLAETPFNSGASGNGVMSADLIICLANLTASF